MLRSSQRSAMAWYNWSDKLHPCQCRRGDKRTSTLHHTSSQSRAEFTIRVHRAHRDNCSILTSCNAKVQNDDRQRGDREWENEVALHTARCMGCLGLVLRADQGRCAHADNSGTGSQNLLKPACSKAVTAVHLSTPSPLVATQHLRELAKPMPRLGTEQPSVVERLEYTTSDNPHDRFLFKTV